MNTGIFLCANCAWWHPCIQAGWRFADNAGWIRDECYNELNSSGECRRYPPNPDDNSSIPTAWNHYCGEYKPDHMIEFSKRTLEGEKKNPK